jgi:hypothetical protein
MTRTSLAIGALTLALFSAGCCMCDAPYDYCGPVYTGGPCGPCCLENERIGSAFTGPYAMTEYGEPIDGQIIEEGGSIETMPEVDPADESDAYYDARKMAEAEPPIEQHPPQQMATRQPQRRPSRSRTTSHGSDPLQSALAEIMPQTFGQHQRKPIKR